MDLSELINQLILLNFIVAALLSFRARGRKDYLGVSKIAIYLFGFSSALLFLELAYRVPIVDGEARSIRWQLLAFTLAALPMVLSIWIPLASSISFASPLISLILLAALSTGSSINSITMPLVAFHVAGALMGFLLALLSACLSLLFLWQEGALKNRQLSRLSNSSPPLDQVDRALSACLWTGFCFLSAALVSGAASVLFVSDLESLGSYLFKILMSVAVWLWYLVILFARFKTRILGTSIAKMSLLGLCFLSIVFFGLSFSNS